jgi:hypothetical protein
MLLAQNPEVREKLQAELKDVIGNYRPVFRNLLLHYARTSVLKYTSAK